MTYYTTLNRIRDYSPCVDGWKKLLRNLGKTQADDEPLSIIDILDLNGLDDAIWCLRAVDGLRAVGDIDKDARLFAVWCARQVQHLMTAQSIAALDIAERYTDGAAYAAADAALWAASSAAAYAAARAVANEAARVAANAPAWDQVSGVTSVAASTATMAAAVAAQEAEFRRRFGGAK